MLRKGSSAVLKTKDAIYSPCEIVNISKDSVTVTYLAGTGIDAKTKKPFEKRPVETIKRKDIISLSERY